VEVFCWCDPQLTVSRMQGRHGAGRHPIHRDVINPLLLDRAAAVAAQVVPLELGGRLIRVDTGQPGAAEQAVAAVTALDR